MNVRVLLIAVAFLASTVSGFAAEQRKVIGEGLRSCGAWTKERQAESPQSALFATWVLGYVTGMNWVDYSEPDFLMKTDAFGILAWVDNYCRTHPVDTINRAASEVVEFLKTRP